MSSRAAAAGKNLRFWRAGRCLSGGKQGVSKTDRNRTSEQVLARVEKSPLCCELQHLMPVRLERVVQDEQQVLWNTLVREYHYLGHGQMPGCHLKYLGFCGRRVIAAIGWRAASLKLEARDCFIGWSDQQRRAGIGRIANNNRLLILPWVRVKSLVSYLLSRNIKLLVGDWQQVYGQKLLVLETFVDADRFAGTCYKASNWIHVGETKGYTKRGAGYVYHGHRKEVYLYVVDRRFRRILGTQQRPLPQRSAETEKREKQLQMVMGIEEWDPEVIPPMGLTEEQIPLLADELVSFHDRFSRYYRRREQRRLGLAYLRGLFTRLKRKTAEGIALLLLGPKAVRSLQDFISSYGWDDEGMLGEYQRSVSEQIVTEDGMLNVDASEFVKKGSESVGVGRQYCGTRGKVENCQSGVFLGYAGQKGYGLVDCRLYLPKPWFEESQRERWKKCHIPEGVQFQTKIQIAVDLITKAKQSGLFAAKWLGCDASFGASKAFLDQMGNSYWYFAQVPSHTLVWTEKPQLKQKPYSGRGRRPSKPQVSEEPITVLQAATVVPLKLVNIGEGAKGPIMAEVAATRVWEVRDGLPGRQRWLFIRRYANGQVKYALSNAPAEIEQQELLRASTLRWPIEQCFQEGKQQLGMNEYEHRSWAGWHRHMLFVFMAHLFLLKLRHRFKKNSDPDAYSDASADCGGARRAEDDTAQSTADPGLSHSQKPCGISVSSQDNATSTGQGEDPVGLLNQTRNHNSSDRSQHACSSSFPD